MQTYSGLMAVLVICKNKEDPFKMRAIEWAQHFSHYKYMGIFQDAQGQLTSQSQVRSCRISNPFEIFWFSSLPARIKTNQLNTRTRSRWGTITNPHSKAFDPPAPNTGA